MNFKQWINELFDIENGKPTDGRWINEKGDSIFLFNLKSDPNVCDGRPCYYVKITNQGIISFGHVDTGADDRFVQNQESGTSGQEMLNSVLWAIKDYVEKANPPVLSWTAVNKSRLGARNAMAREKIYNKLAARFLAQNYIQQDKFWVRKDMVGKWQPTEVPNANFYPTIPPQYEVPNSDNFYPTTTPEYD
jgi:hypothetical protein